uniref:TNFR-Cys domain-containing protein n=1 Tax=Crocodylus porosus TaxID=8502 RepID=A0A7M4DVU5_CROPO
MKFCVVFSWKCTGPNSALLHWSSSKLPVVYLALLGPSAVMKSCDEQGHSRQLICDKCPAGTYVSKHCTKTTLRECSPCPVGTFTKHENGIERCHLCSEGEVGVCFPS